MRPTSAAGLTPSKRGGIRSPEKGRSQAADAHVLLPTRKWTKRESTPGELNPAAAGGRRRQGSICAATPYAGRFLRLPAYGIVANRKGFRFPFPWTPSLKRQRRGLLPSFDPPCRCADLRDTRQRRTFPQVRQSPHLFSPRGTGRRGRRPLHTQSTGSRFQGRRLPHLRGKSFNGRQLPSLYNGGEILKRGYPPLEAFQLGRVKGGEEIAIFPSLVSFSFPLSLGQARERGSFLCALGAQKTFHSVYRFSSK